MCFVHSPKPSKESIPCDREVSRSSWQCSENITEPWGLFPEPGWWEHCLTEASSTEDRPGVVASFADRIKGSFGACRKSPKQMRSRGSSSNTRTALIVVSSLQKRKNGSWSEKQIPPFLLFLKPYLQKVWSAEGRTTAPLPKPSALSALTTSQTPGWESRSCISPLEAICSAQMTLGMRDVGPNLTTVKSCSSRGGNWGGGGACPESWLNLERCLNEILKIKN